MTQNDKPKQPLPTLTPVSITTANATGVKPTTKLNGALAPAKHSVGLPGLHARLRNPNVAQGSDPNTKPNRLALILDCSGSMSGSKIQSLRDACVSFIQSCNFSDTALALEPFSTRECEAQRVPLSCFEPFLTTTVQMLTSHGSTPMAEAMDFVLQTYSLTRAVLVSDGQPDSEESVYEVASRYREASLPCDCVHIGDSTDGEACLRKVAEMTGGQYIKFTDITSFSRSFKYLTPAFYGQLTSGGVTAAQLGAKEIK